MDFKDVGNCEKNIKLDQAKCIDKQRFCVWLKDIRNNPGLFYWIVWSLVPKLPIWYEDEVSEL